MKSTHVFAIICNLAFFPRKFSNAEKSCATVFLFHFFTIRAYSYCMNNRCELTIEVETRLPLKQFSDMFQTGAAYDISAAVINFAFL